MKRRIVKNVFLASSLALTLFAGSLAFTTPAKAAGATTPVLKIKKVLNLPESGVKTPAETFTFKFDGHSKNGKVALATEVPAIANKTVVYANTDTTDADATTPGKQVVKMTDDILQGITFTSAGQYTYTVTEVRGSTTDMTYSSASYLVSIFTKTTSTGAIVVDSIQIKQEKNDDGTANTTGTKVAYNPGTDNNGTGNNFVFNNKYDKKDGNNNPSGNTVGEADKKGFVLQKKIVGTNPNLDERFTFKLKVEKPVGSHSADTSFKYYIVSGNNKGTEKTGTYGNTGVDVELKHTDRVVFSSVLLGSKVSVEETSDGGYTQGIGNSSTLNGQAVASIADLKTGKVISEDGDNVINFENTQQTPTGIFLNNLPFIVLALMAGIGIFFFVKNRREEEELEI